MSEILTIEQSGDCAVVASAGTEPRHTPVQESFRVWACDNQVYGPVSAATLAEWVQDGRVFRDTWVYLEPAAQWRLAHQIASLHPYFHPGEDTAFFVRRVEAGAGVSLAELRQFAIFTGLSANQLLRLLESAQVQEVAPHEVIIRRREPGDALFLVLSGCVRARLHVGGDERLLSKIGAGEFFGELSMLTRTPRTADVVAEEGSRLLRFTAEAFQKLIAEDPAVAAPILQGIARMLAHRIVDDNKRYQMEVAAEFVWR